MDRGAARDRLLSQHVQINAALGELEALALRVAGGDRGAAEVLDVPLTKLRPILEVHTALEETYMGLLVAGADGWGLEHVRALREAHAAAHDTMERAAAEAADPRGLPALRAAGALTLITALRDHMRVEEKYLLTDTSECDFAVISEIRG